MRLEYGFDLAALDLPRFSVEADESIGKLFTLTTLILNVLENRPQIEIVFHGINEDDPIRKIDNFKQIVAESTAGDQVRYTLGRGGRVTGTSYHFQWLTVEAV